MKETYDIKYRQPGQWFWRKIKGVKGTGVQEQRFWVFHTEDDAMHYVGVSAEVYFPPERQAIITYQMSREAGQHIPRA